MKRSILIFAAFISFIAASLAFMSADEPKYKNLKVLKKNITKKELDSTMRFFTMSLGERCPFCHAKDDATGKLDFASDANPHKNVARFMLRMNAKINKKYFKNMNKEMDDKDMTVQSVTCYTCHHGQGEPAVKPGPMSGNNMGMPPPPGMNGNMGTPPPGGMRPPMPGDSAKMQH